MPALPAAGITAAGIRIIAASALLLALQLRRVQLVQSLLELLARVGEVFEQLHLEVEVDDERLVLIRPQHLLDKADAGAALVGNHAPLAAAGIDQQPQREGKVGLA